MSSKKPFLALILLPLLTFSFACGGSRGSMKQPTGVMAPPAYDIKALSNVRKIAVLDFYELKEIRAAGAPNLCPVTNMHFIHGKAPAGSGKTVADQFHVRLARRGFEVIDRDLVDEVLNNLPESEKTDYTIALGAKVGQALSADAVVMGVVMKFDERVGTKLGADKPASVGFSVAIVSVPDGKILWKAKFEKTQRALSENLLDYKTFFRGGMVWQKASQLSAIGIENILDRLPVKHGSK